MPDPTPTAPGAVAPRGDAALFDRIADEGRRTRLPISAYADLYRRMGLLDWLDAQGRDEPILEVGTCDALHLVNLAELTGRTGVGIDVSVASLHSGAREAAARGLPVRLAAMDALHTGLATARFRTILFFGMLHHFFFEGLAGVLAEAARLLHPEGRVFVAEPSLLYPYHVLAFGGARVAKRFARVQAIDRNFTDSEMALWPGRLTRVARDAGLVPLDGSLGYFDYVSILPQSASAPSPWLFRAACRFCRLVGRLGPTSWRHDFFHMTFQPRQAHP